MFVAVVIETSLKFPFFHIYMGKISYGNTTCHDNGLIELQRKGEHTIAALGLVIKADILYRLFFSPVVSVQFVIAYM